MLRTVKTNSGLVAGLPAADPRISSFKGIPFAKPPVGPLRWREPQPCETWEGVKACYQFAPISMQSIPGLDENNIYTKEWNVDPAIPMSEDCLYLNVWTPAKSDADNLPVLVWYFGGALQWGNCAEMEFDGERIARRGIVVVSVNYRLNVFGFLTHPDMKKENPNTCYNLGHMDQLAGLRWVKENIKAFGGNSEQITIAGQSAGGGSVMALLNSQPEQNLIHGAIIESGIFFNPFERTYETPLEMSIKQSQDFFEFLGVKTLEEARTLPAEFIRDKNDEFGKFWGTVIDGVFQSDTYWNNISMKKFLDIPILTGYTNNEFLYDDMNIIELGVNMLYHDRRNAGYTAPQYVYEFGADIPGDDNPGAFHSVDLWFFFETLTKCHRPFVGKHYDLARKMCDYWCYFIKNGNPNGHDCTGVSLKQWDAYDQEKQTVMLFYEEPEATSKQVSEKIEYYMKHVKKVYNTFDVGE